MSGRAHREGHRLEPRRSRRLRVGATAVVACVAAVCLSAFAAPAGAAPLPELECGVIPTTDVVLTSDLTCETGFHFGFDPVPVTIDLRTHTLTVPGPAGSCTSPGPCGAIAGAAVVRNGTVNGSLTDIGTIERVAVFGDVLLAFGQSGTDGPSLMRESAVIDGSVYVWGPDVRIDDNIIRGDVTVVDTNRPVSNLAVTANWIVHSPGSGVSIVPSSGFFPGEITGTIDHNVIWQPNGHGIELGGILMNIGALAIDGNLIAGSQGSGIFSRGSDIGPPIIGGPITVANNGLVLNLGHGVDAGWIIGRSGTGIVDGGGNEAVWNGTTPGCLGITCS